MFSFAFTIVEFTDIGRSLERASLAGWTRPELLYRLCLDHCLREKGYMLELVSVKEAQQLILASQRLIGPTLKPIQIIEHLGYVQIDTIQL